MTTTSDGSSLETAFTAIFEGTYDDLLRFVRRRLPETSSADAEDLVAEAFTIAWRRFDERARTPQDARPWLFGIARRLLLAHHRTKPRDAVGIELAHSLPAARGPDSDYVDSCLDLRQAWNHLSAAYQEVLSLHFLEELSTTEASEVLGISNVAYRLRLSRARKALRSGLSPATRNATSKPTTPRLERTTS